MTLFQNEHPFITTRAVHLDLKGLPPTPKRLTEWLDFVQACKFNAILLELEDQFPWTIDTRFRNATYYTPSEIRTLTSEADRRNIQLIPLVQCLGHLEMVLRHDDYAHLRERPDTIDLLNPLANGATPLIQSMINDVLELMPNVQYFHLGGDEAWHFGSNTETQTYIHQHGKGALYLQHIQPMLTQLNRQQIRPILWHDMMIDWDTDTLRKLSTQADLITWGYQGNPETADHHYNAKHIQTLANAGFSLWAGTAYKGADNIMDSSLPCPIQREENALAWIKQAKQHHMHSMVATGWSRYSYSRLQCDPNDAALDCMALIASIMYDGKAPEGGIQTCRTWLKSIPAAKPFDACYFAAKTFEDIIAQGWRLVRYADEQQIFSEQDPSRDPGLSTEYLGKQSTKLLQRLPDVQQQIHAAFKDLIDPIWINEYLSTRIIPLRKHLQNLQQQPIEAQEMSPMKL
ncbi:family 20 glycosylhydrolase [Poriferisphaera sp. WC338]|uniref:family 20 glycosylhydrolase n=1 Tax=Poriferisphaera sp. WC338 TaxID=3425129 RepID=UPI003D81A50E